MVTALQTEKDTISVVIIEDFKLTRVGLRCALNSNEDINVVAESENATEGLKLIERHKPDVVLMDIGLPDFSGIEAVKRIIEINQNAPIVMLTSHISEQEVTESLQAGARAYVMKDINIEVLKMIIKTVKDGAMWLDPQVVPILRDKNCGIVPPRQMSRAMFKEQHANLTQREYEVLKLVVDGKSNNEIAQELMISEHTAKAHVCNIIQKLVVDDRTQASVKALKAGLV